MTKLLFLLSSGLLVLASICTISSAAAKDTQPMETFIEQPAVQSNSSSSAGNTVQTGAVATSPVQLKVTQCACQASVTPQQQAQTQQKKKHKVLRAIGKELSVSLGDLGKDMALAFSVQGFDPYDMPENPNIPYVAAEAQFIDGSSSQIIRYPDKSIRVRGGFLDGTFACPMEDGLYVVQYINGAQSKMQLTPGVGAVVYRPDNSVTKITKTGSGGYRVENSKIGYMGDITPDTTGLSYEFAKQNF